MAGLSTVLHVPFDGARLAALFECEADVKKAAPSGSWPFDADEWRAWAGEPGIRLFFVIEDGQDVGHFALRDRAGGVHLSWVILRRSRRGGRGRDLMQVVFEAARGLGAQHITLNVLKDNPTAVHLYHAVGFEPVSQTDAKVHMSRRLDAVAPL